MAPQRDDGFSTSKLGSQWEWNHNQRNTHWSLNERSGWLRLRASVPLLLTEDFGPRQNQWTNTDGTNTDFWRACNTLSQRIMGTTTGTAVAKFDLSGMKPGQLAGFVRYGGVYHMLGIYVSEKGRQNLFFIDKMGEKVMGPDITNSDLFVRTSNYVNQAFYEYSLDGKTYERFGPDFTIEFGKWTGDRLGFFCWNEKHENGYIDVDWFKFDYYRPKEGKQHTQNLEPQDSTGRFSFLSLLTLSSVFCSR